MPIMFEFESVIAKTVLGEGTLLPDKGLQILYDADVMKKRQCFFLNGFLFYRLTESLHSISILSHNHLGADFCALI